MMHPPSAYRDAESPARRTLFAVLGVPWTANAKSLQFPLTRSAFGIFIAFVFMPNEELLARVSYGLVFGVLLMLTQGLHIVGHTLGGKLVNAPMDENFVTPVSILNVYRHDPPALPGRVHLARALGGPLMNIGVGAVAAAAWSVWGGALLLYSGAFNLLLGLGILRPVAGGDGQVIWRELFAQGGQR